MVLTFACILCMLPYPITIFIAPTPNNYCKVSCYTFPISDIQNLNPQEKCSSNSLYFHKDRHRPTWWTNRFKPFLPLTFHITDPPNPLTKKKKKGSYHHPCPLCHYGGRILGTSYTQHKGSLLPNIAELQV